MKSLCLLLGLALLAVACGAKKLWGVDVGKKEDVRAQLDSCISRDSPGYNSMTIIAVRLLLQK